MNTEDRLSGLLGMCRRSGHLISGFDAVVEAAEAGSAVLILLAADASPKTEKELRFRLGRSEIPVVRIPLDKVRFGAVTGLHKPIALAATDDQGFADSLQRMAGN